MAPVLGYWNIRGLCEPIRFLLHHVGVDFVDERMNVALDVSGYEKWLEKKYTLGLEFPNLPYYIDEDVKLTQSLVIMRYLARKHGLFPESPGDVIKAETIEQVSRDLVYAIIMQFTGGDDSTVKSFALQRLKDLSKLLSENLGAKDFFVGDRLSYADFLIFESLDHVSYLVSDLYALYPNIGQFAKRIESLPNIQKMINDGKFKRWPLYSPYISWGSGGEEPKRQTS